MKSLIKTINSLLDKHPKIVSLLLSTSLIVAVNLFLGTYFEEYEIIINQLLLEQFNTSVDVPFSTVYFGSCILLTKLTNLFPSLSVYSLLYTFFNFIGLYLITLFLLKYLKQIEIKFYTKLFLLFLVQFLFIENILFVNAVRTSMLVVFASQLWFYYGITNRKRNIFFLPVFFLFALGSDIRIEMGAILSLLLVAFTILFMNRKAIVLSCLMLVFASSLVVGYHYGLNTYYPDVKIIHNAEHEFQDRKHFDVDVNDPVDIQIKTAMRAFIADSGVYDMKDYEAILDNTSATEYLFSRAAFDAYIAKIRQTKKELKGYEWFLLLTIFIILLILLNINHLFTDRTTLIRVWLFIAVCLSIPFLLNTWLFVSYRFLVVYVSILNILGILTIILRYNSKAKLPSKSIILVAIAILLATFTVYITKKIKVEHENRQISKAFEAFLERAANNHKNIVISNITFDLYSARLFTTCLQNSIDHYYLDFYFHHVYNYYQRHHAPFFGKNYGSLISRIERCMQDDVIFISNDYYNALLHNYLQTVHSTDISFVPNGYFESENMKSYTIQLN